MVDKQLIIVASNKDWHLAEYQKIKLDYPQFQWCYVTTPEDLLNKIEKNSVKIIFFVHWSWIVPQEMLTEIECICFHMTDLPYGRGGTPLQNLIARGHKETTLTAFRMVKELDAGPYYLKEKMSLEGKAEQIYIRAADISWRMIRTLIENNIEPSDQVGEPVIFSRFKPEDSVLPDNGDLNSIFDKIRMHDAITYPLAFIDYGDFRILFADVKNEGDHLLASAKIIKK